MPFSDHWLALEVEPSLLGVYLFALAVLRYAVFLLLNLGSDEVLLVYAADLHCLVASSDSAGGKVFLLLFFFEVGLSVLEDLFDQLH